MPCNSQRQTDRMPHPATPAWTLAEVEPRRKMLRPFTESRWQLPKTVPAPERNFVWRRAVLVVGLMLALAWSLKLLAGV